MPLDLQPGDSYEFQSPRTGTGYAHFSTCPYSSVYNSGETFEVRLEEPLVLGEQYLVSFYVKKGVKAYLEGPCIYASDELGVYFYTDTVFAIAYEEEHQNTEAIENALVLYELDTTEAGNTYYAFAEYLQVPDVALDTLITDEENWYLVSDTLYADKPYEFMTFSRFRTFDEITWAIDEDCVGSAYSRFLVDDVSVHLLGELGTAADAGVDASICLGDSVQIGTSDLEDYMYWWSPNEQMETSIYGGVNSGMPWVSPTETTTYTLVQKDFAFMETSDAVTITVEECNPGIGEYSEQLVNLYPNPASSLVEIQSTYPVESWKLIDGIGREVQHSKLKVENSFSIDVSGLHTGLYFVEIKGEDFTIVKELLVE
jgi:hypothetical protein